MVPRTIQYTYELTLGGSNGPQLASGSRQVKNAGKVEPSSISYARSKTSEVPGGNVHGTYVLVVPFQHGQSDLFIFCV